MTDGIIDAGLLDAAAIALLAERVGPPLEPWQRKVIDLACIVDRARRTLEDVPGITPGHSHGTCNMFPDRVRTRQLRRSVETHEDSTATH